MRIITAFTNRLGNRSNNQDRCLALERRNSALLVVADGMGGHARGELAAQITIDSLSRSFLSHRGPISEPHHFLEHAMNHAHLEVVDAGRSQNPPIDPRTTCVACLVQDDQAWWAHVGDSRLYLLRGGVILARTRDHTPVEELLQQGVIVEEDLRSHPLRNSVSRCLGGKPKLPKISVDQAKLKPDDVLLLCSDGLWSAIPESHLVSFPAYGNFEAAINRITDEAEAESYPHSDNITLVGLRWLSAEANQKASAGTPRPKRSTTPEVTESEQDPLKQAIDDIHRAMLEYSSEMKK
jgi:serine/threonine protein phosphatase PrpC